MQPANKNNLPAMYQQRYMEINFNPKEWRWPYGN
jgi:hypothetical protein